MLHRQFYSVDRLGDSERRKRLHEIINGMKTTTFCLDLFLFFIHQTGTGSGKPAQEARSERRLHIDKKIVLFSPQPPAISYEIPEPVLHPLFVESLDAVCYGRSIHELFKSRRDDQRDPCCRERLPQCLERRQGMEQVADGARLEKQYIVIDHENDDIIIQTAGFCKYNFRFALSEYQEMPCPLTGIKGGLGQGI